MSEQNDLCGDYRLMDYAVYESFDDMCTNDPIYIGTDEWVWDGDFKYKLIPDITG
jgi:hypothetical protein